MLTGREILINLAFIHSGKFDLMLNDIEKKVNLENDKFLGDGSNCITILDAEYPSRLARICCRPPIVLFYKGNLDLLKDDNILSVCSCREHSSNYHKSVDILLGGLDRTIVVGGHVLTDKYVVDNAKKVIAVLPCGLDYKDTMFTGLIDTIVSKGGLVLTEFPADTPPSADNSSMRYRVIEAIAKDTLVLEVQKCGSGMLRAGWALNYGHEVFVAPKDVGDDGYVNNMLLSEGATPCAERGQLEK